MVRSKSIKVLDMKRVVARQFENDVKLKVYDDKMHRVEKKFKDNHRDLIREHKIKNDERRKQAVRRVNAV